MRLNGRRQSTNVDDRRGMRATGKAGIGIGGLLIALLGTWLLGGDPMEVLQQQLSDMPMQQTEQREFSPEEQELAVFSKQILAGTEDIWSDLFARSGSAYREPRMVLFSDAVQTACGGATSQVGPFYCSGDQTVYIDLSFFLQMKRQIGAGGDFAYAYVIAHEVGHHVQYLTGLLNEVHSRMSRLSKTEANKLSVRLELQADFYAGVWAYHDNKRFASLEDGDIELGLKCAQLIGDDYLQKKSRGYAVPETFNHGTSAQRFKWFKLGLTTGDLRHAATIFEMPYEDL